MCGGVFRHESRNFIAQNNGDYYSVVRQKLLSFIHAYLSFAANQLLIQPHSFAVVWLLGQINLIMYAIKNTGGHISMAIYTVAGIDATVGAR